MKNIILDTDLYNEIDDQIALAYVLKSKDTLNLEAVTIAPFTKGEYNTKTSIDKSYEVAKKIFKMCNEQNDKTYILSMGRITNIALAIKRTHQ